LLLPARLTRWKGQAVLVEAMAQVPPPAVAVLAGEGALRGELEAMVAARGLSGRVLLPGHVEDMPAAYAAADVVLHASTEPEAFGRTLVEAGAMERVVIASDLGAPRETVRPGETGWLVPPGDPAALAEAVLRALALPPEQRAAMGRAARAFVLSRFTTEAMQRATLAVYAELLGPSPSVASGG
jgi:glycosyltransferase involved in cell wall biosynthesis